MSNKEIGAALITGASSGIGLVTAKALKQAGYRVFGTSRRAMTATVHLAANTFSHIAIPLFSAVYAPQNQPDHPSVWLVDE
ncbi:MAG: SDR family NAD(P)-dependent oxidoreductase, partial [Nitrosospira sp.]